MYGSDIYVVECNENQLIYHYCNSLTGNGKYYIDRCINQFREFMDHLENIDSMIGFNNSKYDYQILHRLILSRDTLKNSSGSDIAKLSFNIKNMLDDSEEDMIVKDKDWLKPQLDVKSLLGFDKTDIKQVAKRLDMPMESYDDEVDIIKEIYKMVIGKADSSIYRGMNLLATRKFFNKHFNLRCINFSNIKLGERFVLKQLGQIPMPEKSIVYDINRMLPDIIGDIRNEEARQYFERLKTFQPSVVYPSLCGVANFKNIDVCYSNGSIKGSSEPGIYECSDNETIVYYDIVSAFPSIINHFKLHPGHLDQKFVDAVNMLLKMRFRAIDEGNKVFDDTIKKMLVGIYGKMGEEKSMLYDKSTQLNVVIHCQALMTLLIDQLEPYDIEILFVNTDGIMFKCNNNILEYIDDVVDTFMKKFDFRYRRETFDKTYLLDINNFATFVHDNNVESKGIFDDRITLFKNYTQRKAAEIVRKYYFDGIDIDAAQRGYDKESRKLAIDAITKVKFRQYSLF